MSFLDNLCFFRDNLSFKNSSKLLDRSLRYGSYTRLAPSCYARFSNKYTRLCSFALLPKFNFLQIRLKSPYLTEKSNSKYD